MFVAVVGCGVVGVVVVVGGGPVVCCVTACAYLPFLVDDVVAMSFFAALLPQAEAVMCLSPWQLYEPDPNRQYDPDTGAPGDFKQLNALGLEALDALNRGLRANKRNVWLAHLKVHLNEMG